MLKQALTKAPILSYPTLDGDFVLNTDATSGVGAVLSQLQDNPCLLQPHSQQSRQESTRRELLAVIKAIRQFHSYLYGRAFTDHAALKFPLL